MRLRLVLKDPARFPGAQHEKLLANGQIVIGRSSQADWVIPDPDRVISKSHCRLEHGANGFVVIDISVNGVAVNGSAIMPGVPSVLSDGDAISIGAATIVALVESGAGGLSSRLEEPGFAFSEGPFGFDPQVAQKVSGVELASPSVPPPSAVASPLKPDWWNPDAVRGVCETGAPTAGSDSSVRPVALAASSGRVAAIVAESGCLELDTLVNAVEQAAQSLSAGEREAFIGSLSIALAGGRVPWR